MLIPVPDGKIDSAVNSVASEGNPAGWLLKTAARAIAGGKPFARPFADDPDNPGVFVLFGADWINAIAKDDTLYRKILECVLEKRGGVPEDFPASGAWDSRREGEKTPYVFLNHAPSALARAALELGFVHTGEVSEVEPAANLWFIEGNHDFTGLVKYECRMFEGGELFDVIKAGWPHGSEDGRYIRWCLDAGPSFACFDGGKIVCASSTHLSGTMGMIYTPDEYRGKGYASSLAAFQTTEMLRRNKIAIAHIWHSNEPSKSLVKKLGFSLYPGWFGWWRMSFPS